ncbi:recombinase [Brumimicrobium glaciale]|uniref:Recombinase n=1 Tax=Brumimicrobium glaciale TaxID=200475 RepID=A0A4V1WGB2_9FLAO|nr:recombinase [Brumimicrobium glaciale]RYM36091.1 recombinase [Brumimicrobium glaciale]
MEDKENLDWDKQTENIEKKNNILIDGFYEHLTTKSINPKTIQNHINNVDFYVNTFLLRYGIIPAEEGSNEIGEFLGDFFIRKAMWSNKASVKQNTVSLKKFYTYLNEIGELPKKDLIELKLTIKIEADIWIERVEKYNNTDDDWY